MNVISFKEIQPNPDAERVFAGYVQTAEDRKAIQEWLESEHRVAVGLVKERQVSETETRQ